MFDDRGTPKKKFMSRDPEDSDAEDSYRYRSYKPNFRSDRTFQQRDRERRYPPTPCTCGGMHWGRDCPKKGSNDNSSRNDQSSNSKPTYSGNKSYDNNCSLNKSDANSPPIHNNRWNNNRNAASANSVSTQANPVKTRRQKKDEPVAAIEPIQPAVSPAKLEAIKAQGEAPLQERYIEVAPTIAQAHINKESGTLHEVCIDTGSSISLIDHAYFKKHFPTNRLEVSSATQLDGVGSNTTQGWTELTLHLLSSEKENMVTVVAAFYVVSSLATPILLGNVRLVSEAVVIDIAKGFATFGTSKVPVKIRSTKPEIFFGEQTPATARIAQTFTINPGYQARVPITIDIMPTSSLYYLEPVDISPSVRVDESVATSGAPAHYAHIINLGNGPVRIPQGAIIGSPRPVSNDHVPKAHAKDVLSQVALSRRLTSRH
jgi:hypothetical protein